jgi:hypothetical protein
MWRVAPMTRVARLSRAALVAIIGSVVTLPALGQVPKLERVIEIGCEDCADARQFSSLGDVSVNEAGDVLVIDRDAPTLRMFDKTGKPLWARGRPGAGPGEYRFVMRAATGPNGSVHVVDMRLRRLTRLAADGSVAKSLAIPFFVAGAAARGRQGELVLLSDDFRSTGSVYRWLPTAEAPVQLGSFKSPPPGEATFGGSIAVAPNGSIAYFATADTYAIHRFSPTGQPLPDIGRDIPRPRRTPEEIAAMKQRMLMAGAAAKSAQEQKSSGGSKSLLTDDERFLYKPHASADALRYDDAGRLWVRTMRGTNKTTVFDVFSGAGAFIGEVTVPLRVDSYSLAGQFMATATEREDGTPIVVVWSVR